MIRVVVLILTAVLVIDLASAALFFRSVPLGVLALLAAAGLAVLAARLARRAAPHRATGWDIGEALEITNPDRPVRMAATLDLKVLNLGVLAIGAPGAGKTESVLLGYIDALRHAAPDWGWAVFEGKGDIDIYKKAVATGRRPDYFFSSELPGSDSINLLQGEPHDVADRLGQVLIGHTASTSFYADSQRAVLNRLVPLLLQAGAPANLRDLYVVLTVEDAGSELLRRAKDAGVDPAQIQLAAQWLGLPLAGRLKEISGMLNRLFVFVNGPYADRLNAYQPDIDLTQAVPAGKSVYFHLPLTDFARDVAVAIVEQYAVEARKRQLGGTDDIKSYPLMFDDWGAFFHPGFGPFSARCRSARMPLSFGFQSRAQLQAVSLGFADELDDTIATKIVLRVQGAATAEYATRLLGEYDTQQVSMSEFGERGGSSVGLGRRTRIEARDLRQLQPGEAYISTLLPTEGGRTVNALWRARLPLPNFAGWKDVPMPAPKIHPEGEGLGFWRRYMDSAALNRIHAEVAASLSEQGEATQVTQRQAAAAARRDLDDNPGLDLAAEPALRDALEP